MLPPTLRVYVAAKPIDLRTSFDRLAGIVRDQFGDDPRSGALFFFTNKAADRCKILFADKTGYCLLYKRLDAGRFTLPTGSDPSDARVAVDAETFARLLDGVAREAGVGGQRRKPRVH
jgi:transposase